MASEVGKRNPDRYPVVILMAALAAKGGENGVLERNITK